MTPSPSALPSAGVENEAQVRLAQSAARRPVRWTRTEAGGDWGRGRDGNRLRIHKLAALHLSQQTPTIITDKTVRELWGALVVGTSQKASGVISVMYCHQSKNKPPTAD